MNITKALLFGAGAAVAYNYRDQILDALDKLGETSEVQATESSAHESKAIEEVPRVVHHSGVRTGTVLIVLPTAAFAAYLGYLKVVKGYSLADLFYFTKAFLLEFVAQAQNVVEKLKELMYRSKSYLMWQIEQIFELYKQRMGKQ
eukprot:TRINITY_DN1879_c1_g2_i1.p2 TRINITY_DN1879_c1_g2~~TRINITY_DN1879_c1_g2_i1.p2  ORF type:complete len:145 (-),score=18.35 TRINITY_DN1879_c1_g2_i1:546-980(-)